LNEEESSLADLICAKKESNYVKSKINVGREKEVQNENLAKCEKSLKLFTI